MFGLMRKNTCDPPLQKLKWKKNHYCGTCKAMGTQYGHRTRLFLNYDLVFLSELLTHLSKDPVSFSSQAFQSVNCFRTPEHSDIPPPLKFAAAVGVLYADIKIQDNLIDGKNLFWRISKFSFQNPIDRSKKDLANWGIDLKLVDHWLKEQHRRETQRNSSSFYHYAEPTAEVTAHVFKTGAAFIGNSEANNEMEALGRNFGQIIYWLDACEDFIEDKRQKNFNPFQVIYGQYPGRQELAQIEKYLYSLEEETCELFGLLPFATEWKDQLASRLHSNLFIRTNAAFQKIENHVKSDLAINKLSFFGSIQFRIQNRWRQAFESAFRLNSNSAPYGQYALATAFFVFPKIPDSFVFEKIVYRKKTKDPCEDECVDPCCEDSCSECESCCQTLNCLVIVGFIAGLVAALICAFKDVEKGANRVFRKQKRQLRKEKRDLRRDLRKVKKQEKA